MSPSDTTWVDPKNARIFMDLWFAAFAPLAILGVWITPEKLRVYALLIACVIFHAHYAGPAGMAPIILLAIVTFVSLSGSSLFRLGVVFLAVGALVRYKYADFLNHLVGVNIPLAAAPLGISFFVFEFVHQLIDRNHKKLKQRVRWLEFSVFSIFFPSLAAGPVKRFQQFQPELKRLGRPNREILLQSLVRILIGAAKKLCLGDSLALELPVVGDLGAWHGSIVTLTLMQGLRIFVDFSGYSDIAIGLAGLLNIRLPENFSFPYLATDISDFWRRWHVSLSAWIRDYVYIILGGNRVAPLRRFANLLIAMILCGLWHGAATNFAIWGLMHGLALTGVILWRKYTPLRLPAPLAWTVTFVFVQASWLVFFYPVGELLSFLKNARLI